MRAEQDRISGYAVILPDGPAERLVGYWSYSVPRRNLPIEEMINWFSVPLQVSSSGAVEVDLWQPMQGGFVQGGDLELSSIPGADAGIADRIVFKPLDGEGNVDRFMGAFRVTGFSGRIPWEGVIGLVMTPYVGPEGYVCGVVLVIQSAESGEVRVSQQCHLDVRTGQIRLNPFELRAIRSTAWGSIRSGVLEFTLNRGITREFYQTIELRGVRY